MSFSHPRIAPRGFSIVVCIGIFILRSPFLFHYNTNADTGRNLQLRGLEKNELKIIKFFSSPFVLRAFHSNVYVECSLYINGSVKNPSNSNGVRICFVKRIIFSGFVFYFFYVKYVFFTHMYRNNPNTRSICHGFRSLIIQNRCSFKTCVVRLFRRFNRVTGTVINTFILLNVEKQIVRFVRSACPNVHNGRVTSKMQQHRFDYC